MRCEFLCSLVLMFATANAMAVDIACPAKIETAQKLLKPVAGWQAFVRPIGDHKTVQWSRVARIDLYSGHPNEIAELKPDDENAPSPSWSFDRPAAVELPLWMSCVYFDTRIEFVKALPVNVRKCTAKRDGVLHCEEFAR